MRYFLAWNISSFPLCKRGTEGDLTVAALATFLNPPTPFYKGGDIPLL